MTLMEATSYIIHQHARETSAGKDIDKYWEPVIPEALNFAENEIFLTFHRGWIDEPIKRKAARFAQTLSPRDTSNLDEATLMLHCFIYEWWLRMSENTEFQTLVDQYYRVTYDATTPIRWVKGAHIWIPQTDGIARKISLSLIKRYRQMFFAQRCYAEIGQRGRQNPYVKSTFVLLTDFDYLRQEQVESYQWLRDISRSIAPDVGEDALQDWLKKLLQLSPHLQIQKVGSTEKAIREGAIDLQYRKGGKYQHVPFDEDLTNTMPAESTTDSHEGIGVEKLRAGQSQLEKILSNGNPKAGKRRFKVMEMLTHTSCQKTIARALNVSEGTITGDIKIIKKARFRIQEILDD